MQWEHFCRETLKTCQRLPSQINDVNHHLEFWSGSADASDSLLPGIMPSHCLNPVVKSPWKNPKRTVFMCQWSKGVRWEEEGVEGGGGGEREGGGGRGAGVSAAVDRLSAARCSASRRRDTYVIVGEYMSRGEGVGGILSIHSMLFPIFSEELLKLYAWQRSPSQTLSATNIRFSSNCKCVGNLTNVSAGHHRVKSCLEIK